MPGPFNIEGPDGEGWYYLSSLDAAVNGKYLIRANTREALEVAKARLANGELPEPHMDARKFRLIRMSDRTPMYETTQR